MGEENNIRIDYETTLADVRRICKAVEEFADVRAKIKVLSSKKRFENLVDYFKNETYAYNAMGRELKPLHQDYEILRNTIRDGIFTLKNMPDIPDLSEFLNTIEDRY